MDNPNTYISSGVTGGIISIVYIVYKIFKHSACRSKCCGQTTELQIDLEKGLLQRKKPTITPSSSNDSSPTNDTRSSAGVFV